MNFQLALAAALGFTGVALGAFGAHGLRSRLAAAPDGTRRLEWWQTGASYQLVHALAIGLCSTLGAQAPRPGLGTAVLAFAVGVLLFSGSLYVMAVTGIRKLGAVTPLGGLGFLVGWASLLWAALAG